jgi:small conductance mechanosensitive channel
MEESLTTVQKLINTIIEYCVNYSFQVLGAILVLVIGAFIANRTAKFLMTLMQKKKMDITLSKFTANTIKFVILAFALIIALGKFGITITPFVAALGGATFGASLALQGPLSNYGAGLSIVLTRPYVVGNTIQVAGVSGIVKEVKLACTVLTDEDGIDITIPSKQIVGEILHNSRAHKIVETAIGITYDSNPELAIQTIQKVLANIKEVAKNPSPQIGIQEFGDSSIDIGLRYWVPTSQYFRVSYEVNLAIFKALNAAKISMPFPQREIRILSGAPQAAAALTAQK